MHRDSIFVSMCRKNFFPVLYWLWLTFHCDWIKCGWHRK